MRFAITPSEIQAVVTNFYARVRNDPVLGPIFTSHVTDWPGHEQKIVEFWCGAITGRGEYEGNPMRAHLAAGNVAPAHFGPWLALFDLSLKEELSPDLASQWSFFAHRIGHGLRSGLEFQWRRLNNAV